MGQDDTVELYTTHIAEAVLSILDEPIRLPHPHFALCAMDVFHWLMERYGDLPDRL